jgi:hypothetical protein
VVELVQQVKYGYVFLRQLQLVVLVVFHEEQVEVGLGEVELVV